MAYKILKQFIPTDVISDDPLWAQRQVWVEKLNSEDTIETFTKKADATARKTELEAADPTSRVYKIEKIT